MLPNEIEAMWGLVINDQQDLAEHAIWWTGRDLDQSQWNLFLDMLSGKECKNRIQIKDEDCYQQSYTLEAKKGTYGNY